MRNVSAIRERLLKAGLVYPTMLGIQIDLNPAWKPVKGGFEEASFCNYDCTEANGGGYNCPAAKSLNEGIVPTTMAGFDELMDTLVTAMAGQRRARELFMQEDFDDWCACFAVDGKVKVAYRAAI